MLYFDQGIYLKIQLLEDRANRVSWTFVNIKFCEAKLQISGMSIIHRFIFQTSKYCLLVINKTWKPKQKKPKGNKSFYMKTYLPKCFFKSKNVFKEEKWV